MGKVRGGSSFKSHVLDNVDANGCPEKGGSGQSSKGIAQLKCNDWARIY